MDAMAVTTKGPIIQGMGVAMATQASAAAKARAKVKATRAGVFSVNDIRFSIGECAFNWPSWLSCF
jgi:hypothetical protein